ncbi:MAG TPA: LysM peptidoglycan-binding domain-containing protein [Saprospiraceae bacterium]|nr:LysM peptidoglycan-binding domain-containing protein [Saprospiraceae bacterium]HNT19535.1 LysM peptidoglycan-binding domain-containing protein [Saprospiraceae bacterium]
MLRSFFIGLLVTKMAGFPIQVKANDSWIKDTIYVKLDDTYGKYVEHRVEKKQTLFSLAKAYGIDLYDVYDYNPALKTRILAVNDLLHIPISSDHIITNESQLDSNKKYRPVYYIIKPKDNLYRISKFYFNMAFDDVVTRNRLTSHTIRVGQKLMIGWFDPSKKESGNPDYKPNIIKNEQITLEQKWTEANPSAFTVEYKAIDLTSSEWASTYGKKENSSDRLIEIEKPIAEISLKERKTEAATSPEAPALKTAEASKLTGAGHEASLSNHETVKSATKTKVLKRRMVTQNGVAQWAKSGNQVQDLYVLHPTAPVNSVVELTNPMTHRKIYAKVLSHMPPKLYPDDVSVVVSPGVANLLGAIDSRFYVKLRFVEETIQ